MSVAKGYGSDGEEPSINLDGPFRVLGVALVVDQRGTGAKLVAKYPTQPSKSPLAKALTDSGEGQYANSKTEMNHPNNDLFFTLTARQMAKLFRTKKTLCGSPMTLTVNGTVFCCRSVMMEDDGHEEAHSGNEAANDSLVLFSVIVAMSALVHPAMAMTKASTERWLDPAVAEDGQLELSQRFHVNESSIATADARHPKVKHGRGGVSSEFLSIRRVHLSLARYCRVLEREERRCQYVSLQTNHFSRIRSEQRKKWELRKVASGGGKILPSGSSSTASVMPPKTIPSTGDLRNRHGRASSSVSVGGDDLHLHAHQYDLTISEEQEKEQEILELMLAAPPP